MEPHLISPKAAPLQLLQHLRAEFGYNRAEHAQAASVAQLEPGQTCAAGDVVILRSGHVGEAWLHCRLSDGALFTVMVLHEPMGRNSFRTTADTLRSSCLCKTSSERACILETLLTVSRWCREKAASELCALLGARAMMACPLLSALADTFARLLVCMLGYR